nr:MAG TPA: hypothetical protein [Caudoviricetes sp.]
MFYGYSSHYSLLCIFTSLGRMCKHPLRSLIVKIPFSSMSKNAVLRITISFADLRFLIFTSE